MKRGKEERRPRTKADMMVGAPKLLLRKQALFATRRTMHATDGLFRGMVSYRTRWEGRWPLVSNRCGLSVEASIDHKRLEVLDIIAHEVGKHINEEVMGCYCHPLRPTKHVCGYSVPGPILPPLSSLFQLSLVYLYPTYIYLPSIADRQLASSGRTEIGYTRCISVGGRYHRGCRSIRHNRPHWSPFIDQIPYIADIPTLLTISPPHKTQSWPLIGIMHNHSSC